MHFGLILGLFFLLGELMKFLYFALSSHMVDDAYAVVGGFFGFLIYLYLQCTQLFLAGLMNCSFSPTATEKSFWESGS